MSAGQVARLTQGSIPRHVLEQTAPAVVAITASTSVGILDAYFVGQLGPAPLAAIGFIFPVQVALLSVGVGVLVGINSCVARALGAKDAVAAEQRAIQGVTFGLLLGLLLGGALFFGHELLFRALNARGPVLEHIHEYMVPYSLSYAFSLTTMCFNGILRGQGEAVRSSAILMTLAAVNGVLDPLLIAGWGPLPALGVQGAALATAIAFVLANGVGWLLVQTADVKLRLARLAEAGFWRGVRAVGRVGAPAAISNAINPIGMTLLTGILASGSEAAVAAFGAASRVQALAVVPLLALSSSIGPIVGQNWGAQAFDRARRAWGFSMLLCLGYGLVAALVLFAFRVQVARVFTDAPAVIASIASYLEIAAWGFGGFGVLIVGNGALNAVDRASRALGISLARVALVMVPAAFVGRALAGTPGVYGAVLVANLAGAALAFAVGRRTLYA